MVRGEKVEEIKYKEILHYLESNGAIEYKNPKTPGLSEDEIDNFLKVKDKGRTVVAEIKKLQIISQMNMGLMSARSFDG